MNSLLSVTDLCTHFLTPEGTVYAVNGVSFSLGEGETLAVVGESGCGKSVTMLSLLGLIPTPPGQIISGRALYKGKDLLAMAESELEDIRGKDVYAVSRTAPQVTESLRTHLGMNPEQATRRAIELLEWVGIPDPANRIKDFPHQFSGGESR